MKLQNWEAGKADIEQAIRLDNKNPYNYLYLGNYYEKKGKNEKALMLYQKAQTMGIDFHGIAYFIHRVGG